MSRVLLVIFYSLLLLSSFAQDLTRVPPAEQAEATRLFKVYREGLDAPAREAAVKSLLDMHFTVMLALVPIVERDWDVALTAYRSMLQRQAVDTARRKLADPAFKKDVATHRATLARLRGLGKGLSKEQLKGEGEAALNALRGLFKISVEELATAQPALRKAGENAYLQTRVRQMTQQKSVLRNPMEFSEKDLKKEEERVVASVFFSNQQFEKVMEANAKQLVAKAVPQDEAEGVRDLNEMRMVIGLAPVLIDPKLHIAARDHSKDMATLKFFAHDSPVKGKTTPWDRARLAGTSASAENIAMGNPTGASANHSWFLSPGHHVNMFGNHRRVGLGKYESHWTQLFGN